MGQGYSMSLGNTMCGGSRNGNVTREERNAMKAKKRAAQHREFMRISCWDCGTRSSEQ